MKWPGIKQLEAEVVAARVVVEAARCIRHWHDTGRNNEGMIVSAEHVRLLWQALEEYDKVMRGDAKR